MGDEKKIAEAENEQGEADEHCEGKHDWRDDYYGYQCSRCPMFHAYGCAPWEHFDD